MNATCRARCSVRPVDPTAEILGRGGQGRLQRASMKAAARGFTLLELMVTVSCAAVLLVVGVPSFVSFVQNNRATTDTNELVTALNLGRSAATQRGGVVSVCSSSNGTTCSNDVDWSSGWVVLGAGNELIRAWPARTEAGVLVGNSGTVQFQPRGSAAATGLFQVRIPHCTGLQGRDIRVNVAGRVAVTRATCT